MKRQEPDAVFVYGTLKRGECRDAQWPCPPRRVETATTRGELYDLGPYPAFLPGDGCVGGELWTLHPKDLAQTLEVLDEIEEYNQGGVDMYVREVVTCQRDDGSHVSAYIYRYALPLKCPPHQRVLADDRGVAYWHSAR